MLAVEELSNLENNLMPVLKTRFQEIVTYLNRTGKLEDWMQLMQLDYLVETAPAYSTYKNGKIVVIGESKINECVMQGIAKKLGIDSKRLEFCLGYDEAKTADYKKLQYQPQYSLVLFGAMPHSCVGKGNFSSVIARMEQSVGFPPVIRIGGDLKITRSSFRMALEEAIKNSYISIKG